MSLRIASRPIVITVPSTAFVWDRGAIVNRPAIFRNVLFVPHDSNFCSRGMVNRGNGNQFDSAIR
jgi:hypothetical protein